MRQCVRAYVRKWFASAALGRMEAEGEGGGSSMADCRFDPAALNRYCTAVVRPWDSSSTLSMAAPTPPPPDRGPQPSSPDDPAVARALEFSAWAQRNARLLIAVTVVLVLVIGGFLYYRSYQADLHERAATQFMQVEQTVAAGNVPVAVQELRGFIDQFGGTDYGEEARVMLARLHLEGGQPDEAVQVLEQAGRNVGRSALGAQAELLLGAARAEQGDTSAAIDSYRRVGDGARYGYQREEGLTSAALLREETGDYSGAADLYRELVEQYEDGSFERAHYEMRLTEAESRARAQ